MTRLIWKPERLGTSALNLVSSWSVTVRCRAHASAKHWELRFMFAMALRVSKLDGNTYMCIRPFRNLMMQVPLPQTPRSGSDN